jgi:(p)ppGpp synthase/HD superfamily hydrolase
VDHVVAAGLLHDVLEKTRTTPPELEREFGTRIARLVAAVSDDPSIGDYDARKRDLRDRVAGSDLDTLVIYAADKIAKVRELALVSRWRAGQSRNQRKLVHYRASLDMLRRVAGPSDLVMRLDAELKDLHSPAPAGQRYA